MAILPKVKLRALPTFPSRVVVESPILLDTAGGIFTFSLDIDALLASLQSSFEPIHSYINQEITSGASATVATNAKTVRVNKTVGGAITLTMPLAATMGPEQILIADWKGDAGTNNITINLTGSEKIQGLSSWVIAADNGSICLRPIPGVGYAL
ncbi:hypothetical protein ABIF68_007852 [Bradyrhizobium japonicum]|uniref:hypothetical protein n=1 Tax=Bradyrhizobium TaxID=374 RepID=UPI000576D589|nr:MULTISPECIES: hypothetical protein [Bradyrhizobium]MBR0948326.1 hypothetical protein [Bradyrhizobium liaoningense]